MSSARKWLIIAGLLNLAALFSFSTFVSSAGMENDSVPFYYYLINEFTGFNCALLLLPIAVWLIDRHPIRRQNWFFTVPVHLMFTVVYGVAHTLLMTISRVKIYDFFDLGPYDFGEPFYRFLMEYHKQLLGYIITYGLVRFVRYREANLEKERTTSKLAMQAEQLKSRLASMQLETLKQQIQPHFLFNTLNMISAVMYEDIRKADSMLVALSELLRMSLERSADAKTTLDQELQFTAKYLEIMKGRFEDRLQSEMEVDAGLRLNLVPALILQPLVENAIKHHDVSEDSSARVSVRGTSRNGRLMLMIEDNGPGMAEGEPPWQGIGIANIRARLSQLYGGNYSMTFENLSPKGLRVSLDLPLEAA